MFYKKEGEELRFSNLQLCLILLVAVVFLAGCDVNTAGRAFDSSVEAMSFGDISVPSDLLDRLGVDELKSYHIDEFQVLQADNSFLFVFEIDFETIYFVHLFSDGSFDIVFEVPKAKLGSSPQEGLDSHQGILFIDSTPYFVYTHAMDMDIENSAVSEFLTHEVRAVSLDGSILTFPDQRSFIQRNIGAQALYSLRDASSSTQYFYSSPFDSPAGEEITIPGWIASSFYDAEGSYYILTTERTGGSYPVYTYAYQIFKFVPATSSFELQASFSNEDLPDPWKTYFKDVLVDSAGNFHVLYIDRGDDSNRPNDRIYYQRIGDDPVIISETFNSHTAKPDSAVLFLDASDEVGIIAIFEDKNSDYYNPVQTLKILYPVGTSLEPSVLSVQGKEFLFYSSLIDHTVSIPHLFSYDSLEDGSFVLSSLQTGSSTGGSVSSCTDECTLGTVECISDTATRVCEEDPDTGCAVLVDQECAADHVCEQDTGHCVSTVTCEDECSEGAARCSADGSSTEVCSYDENGCLSWAIGDFCDASCSEGSCVEPEPQPSCPTECTVDSGRCNGNSVEICSLVVNAEGNECPEWIPLLTCPTGVSCSEGACDYQCTTTDHGKEYGVAGEVSSLTDGVTMADSCATSNILQEQHCGYEEGEEFPNTVYTTSVYCPDGCVDGACVNQDPGPGINGECTAGWYCSGLTKLQIGADCEATGDFEVCSESCEEPAVGQAECGSSSASSSSVPLAEDLVFWYSFDDENPDQFTDVSGNELHVPFSGGTYFESGTGSSAISSFKSTVRATVSSQSDDFFGFSRSSSLAMWCYVHEIGSYKTYCSISGRTTGTSHNSYISYGINIRGNRVSVSYSFEVFDNGVSQRSDPVAITYKDHSVGWHHFVSILDYESENLILYVDGVEVARFSLEQNDLLDAYRSLFSTSSSRFYLSLTHSGSRYGAVDNGAFDDLMLRTTALSADQVQDLYQASVRPTETLLCVDQCALGTSYCRYGDSMACVEGSNGCTELTRVVCASGEECVEGECRAVVCDDVCTLGESSCVSSTALESCEEDPDTGCPVLVQNSCSFAHACQEGSCVSNLPSPVPAETDHFPQSDRVLLYYDMEEVTEGGYVLDKSGNGYHAGFAKFDRSYFDSLIEETTLPNIYSLDGSFVSGNALTFSSNVYGENWAHPGLYLDFGDTSIVSSRPTTAVTISMLCKSSSPRKSHGLPCYVGTMTNRYSGSGEDYFYGFELEGGAETDAVLATRFKTGDGDYVYPSSSERTSFTEDEATSEWHHVVGVYTVTSGSGGTAKLYVDGLLVDSDSAEWYDVIDYRAVQAFSVKARSNAFIDEVVVWNTALTDEEVVSLYQQYGLFCTDECTLGSAQCSGNGVQTCEESVDGCAVWSDAVACADSETCSEGSCVASCDADAWTVVSESCESEVNTIVEENECGDTRERTESCPPDAVCGDNEVNQETESCDGTAGITSLESQDGVTCTNACRKQQRVLFWASPNGASLYVDGSLRLQDMQGNNYVDLVEGTHTYRFVYEEQEQSGTVTVPLTGLAVSNGINYRFQTCTDECTLGSAQCGGNGVQTCEESVDGCAVWSDAVACADGTACVSGQCIVQCPAETCTLGSVRCGLDNTVEECTIENGCQVWQTAQQCTGIHACEAGQCVQTNSIFEELSNIADTSTGLAELYTLVVGSVGAASDNIGALDVAGGVRISNSIVDTSLPADTSAEHLIVVGGPCVNREAARLLNMPYGDEVDANGKHCWERFAELASPGEGVLALYDAEEGSKLLIAGATADDTRRIAYTVKTFGLYEQDLAVMRTLVCGSSITDVNFDCDELGGVSSTSSPSPPSTLPTGAVVSGSDDDFATIQSTATIYSFMNTASSDATFTYVFGDNEEAYEQINAEIAATASLAEFTGVTETKTADEVTATTDSIIVGNANVNSLATTFFSNQVLAVEEYNITLDVDNNALYIAGGTHADVATAANLLLDYQNNEELLSVQSYAVVADGDIVETTDCSDGTAPNTCSEDKPLFCENGVLSEDPETCGCPAGQSLQDGVCVEGSVDTNESATGNESNTDEDDQSTGSNDDTATSGSGSGGSSSGGGSSGGGSSGGGGGGSYGGSYASSTPQSEGGVASLGCGSGGSFTSSGTLRHSFTNVAAGDSKTLPIYDRLIPLQQIMFTLAQTVEKVTFLVKAKATPPTTAPGEIYQYLQVEPTDLSSDKVSSVGLTFCVTEQWLDEQNISASRVQLMQYTGQWSALPVAPKETNEDFHLFSSTASQAGYYAITVQQPVKKVVKRATSRPTTRQRTVKQPVRQKTIPTAQTPQPSIQDVTGEELPEQKNTLWFVLIGVILFITVGLFVGFKVKHKSEPIQSKPAQPSRFGTEQQPVQKPVSPPVQDEQSAYEQYQDATGRPPQ